VNTALVKQDLLDSLKADHEYRHAWNLESVYTGVCFQLRALREQREWSQAKLGEKAGMAPERISILEDPNADTKPTLKTLLRIANACDVGLEVRFVSYGAVIDRSTETNFKDLEVPSFSDELPELEKAIGAEVVQEFSLKPAKRKDPEAQWMVGSKYAAYHGLMPVSGTMTDWAQPYGVTREITAFDYLSGFAVVGETEITVKQQPNLLPDFIRMLRKEHHKAMTPHQIPPAVTTTEMQFVH
jgi:transcriptional regulator with XRE-family HTH domain